MVLEVTDTEVIVADPQRGRDSMIHDRFREKWRGSGIVVRKKE